MAFSHRNRLIRYNRMREEFELLIGRKMMEIVPIMHRFIPTYSSRPGEAVRLTNRQSEVKVAAA